MFLRSIHTSLTYPVSSTTGTHTALCYVTRPHEQMVIILCHMGHLNATFVIKYMDVIYLAEINDNQNTEQQYLTDGLKMIQF